MAPRLVDVADKAGVSVATASRVFNAKRGVAAETRAAVLAAAETLGYTASRSGQSQSATLGVIVPELENPVFAAFAQALSVALRRGGHNPILGTETDSGISEDDWIEMLLDLRTSGLIVVSGMHADSLEAPQRYERLLDLGLGLVLVNGYVGGLRAAFVSTDDRVAARLAVEHLAALGHQRVGLAVGPERYTPVIRKTAGFLEAAARLGLEAHVESTLFSMEGGAAAARRLIEKGVTGIVCASDVMALGAMHAAHDRGRRVPRDVSVVGYDDSAAAASAGPPLTTLRQPVGAISAATVRLLLDQLGGNGDGARGQEFLFQPELIVRGSTGAAPLRAASSVAP